MDFLEEGERTGLDVVKSGWFVADVDVDVFLLSCSNLRQSSCFQSSSLSCSFFNSLYNHHTQKKMKQ